MNFEHFMKNPRRNAWIMEGRDKLAIEIYVRKSIGLPERYGEVQLANMSAVTPGGGALTRFLDKWEPVYDIMVECILNKRLEAYLIRRGYEMVSVEVEAPDYLRKKGPQSQERLTASRYDAASSVKLQR